MDKGVVHWTIPCIYSIIWMGRIARLSEVCHVMMEGRPSRFCCRQALWLLRSKSYEGSRIAIPDQSLHEMALLQALVFLCKISSSVRLR